MTGSFIIALPPRREGTGWAKESREAQRYHLPNLKAASERPAAWGGCLDRWRLQAPHAGFDVSRYFLLLHRCGVKSGVKLSLPEHRLQSPAFLPRPLLLARVMS